MECWMHFGAIAPTLSRGKFDNLSPILWSCRFIIGARSRLSQLNRASQFSGILKDSGFDPPILDPLNFAAL